MRKTLWIALLIAAAGWLLVPQRAAAYTYDSATCVHNANSYYLNQENQSLGLINQSMPGMQAISSCIQSLLNAFNFNISMFYPNLLQTFNNLIDQACAATRGQILQRIGDGQLYYSPGSQFNPTSMLNLSSSGSSLVSGASGQSSGETGAGSTGVSGAGSGAAVPQKPAPANSGSVWQKLLHRYGGSGG